MIDTNILELVVETINHLADQWSNAPAMLLTEDDVKWHIAGMLHGNSILGLPRRTADDGILGTAVHSEVSWFGSDGILNNRPDITVTDPSRLSILHSMQDDVMLSSKGVHLIGDSILIEIKFEKQIRQSGCILSDAINGDVEKLRRLIRKNRELNPEIFLKGVVAVFCRWHCLVPGYSGDDILDNGDIRVLIRCAYRNDDLTVTM
jgi:hypothetical protein